MPCAALLQTYYRHLDELYEAGLKRLSESPMPKM
jgi:hypothetical protein